MPGPQLDLMPGEKMVLHSHPHWWFFWKHVLAGIGLIVLIVLWIASDGTLASAMQWVTFIAAVVVVAWTLFAYAVWQTTRFAITDQRVAYQSGILRRRGVSIPLNRINNVNFEQSLIARMLNNGIVTIESAGESGDSVFENIPNPGQVRSIIFGQVEADEVADSQRDAAALAEAMRQQNPPQSNAPSPAPSPSPPPPPPPPSPAPGSSVEQRLHELDELRAKGLVSDAEFAQKRSDIIRDL